MIDALSLYKLFNEADGVEQWIEEKVNFHLKYIDQTVFGYMSHTSKDICKFKKM